MMESSIAPLLGDDEKPDVQLHRVRHGAACAILALFVVMAACHRTLRGTALWDSIHAADHAFEVGANYVGDASFGVTGTVAAGAAGLDAFGCVVVGFITALGGGTCRDVLLGRLPIFWLVAWDEALLCVAVCVATFFAWPPLARRRGLSVEGELLFWTDTVGLGVFAANGALVGDDMHPAASCGRDDFREICGGKAMRNRHRHAW